MLNINQTRLIRLS